MRHRKEGKKFHRETGQRRAFVRTLAGDLIRQGRIETTETRAKAIRPVVERLVTIAKKHDVASRRLLLARMQNKKLVNHLMDEVAPRYLERHGGYLRINKLAKMHKRDGTRLATIEFV